MTFNPGLYKGKSITNSELCGIFGCSNQGGMRRSLSTNSLVLVSDHTKRTYHDRWKGNILHYTGMGLRGDQSLNEAQNWTLKNSKTNGVTVFLFEVFEKNQYEFRGQVRLVGEPYQEQQLDLDYQKRLVWMFPLEVL